MTNQRICESSEVHLLSRFQKLALRTGFWFGEQEARPIVESLAYPTFAKQPVAIHIGGFVVLGA